MIEIELEAGPSSKPEVSSSALLPAAASGDLEQPAPMAPRKQTSACTCSKGVKALGWHSIELLPVAKANACPKAAGKQQAMLTGPAPLLQAMEEAQLAPEGDGSGPPAAEDLSGSGELPLAA